MASLFGVVVNTAIIFLEFADSLILEKAQASDGKGPICGLTRDEFRECLVVAGKQRMLPIFLTTATTVGGLSCSRSVGGGLRSQLGSHGIESLITPQTTLALLLLALFPLAIRWAVRRWRPAVEEPTD